MAQCVVSISVKVMLNTILMWKTIFLCRSVLFHFVASRKEINTHWGDFLKDATYMRIPLGDHLCKISHFQNFWHCKLSKLQNAEKFGIFHSSCFCFLFLHSDLRLHDLASLLSSINGLAIILILSMPHNGHSDAIKSSSVDLSFASFPRLLSSCCC
jgi:hypothetical protein